MNDYESAPFHDGNYVFKHKYPFMDLETAISSMESFEAFERFYTDELMDDNMLLSVSDHEV